MKPDVVDVVESASDDEGSEYSSSSSEGLLSEFSGITPEYENSTTDSFGEMVETNSLIDEGPSEDGGLLPVEIDCEVQTLSLVNDVGKER